MPIKPSLQTGVFSTGYATNSFGVGTSAPATQLEVIGNQYISRYGSIAVIPQMLFRKASGTSSSPTAIGASTTIGMLGGVGYGTTGYGTTAAQIRFVSAEAWTDSANGANIHFLTTPVGSTNATTVMRIGSDARVGFGTTTPRGLVELEGTSTDLFATCYALNPSVILQRANGTSGSPTGLLTNNLAGVVGARGYGATGFTSSTRAAVRFKATENWTDSAQGMMIELNTTAVGASTSNMRASIHEYGVSVLSTEVDSAAGLTSKTITRATTILTGTAGASLQITLPSATANPHMNNVIFRVKSTAARANVTWVSTGGSFVDAPTSLVAGQTVSLFYENSNTTFYAL